MECMALHYTHYTLHYTMLHHTTSHYTPLYDIKPH